jgi:hypothetical protein
MSFMLQPYVALLRATTVQCFSKIDVMHMYEDTMHMLRYYGAYDAC